MTSRSGWPGPLRAIGLHLDGTARVRWARLLVVAVPLAGAAAAILPGGGDGSGAGYRAIARCGTAGCTASGTGVGATEAEARERAVDACWRDGGDRWACSRNVTLLD
ncbi:hypothetical protein LNKW23_11540 [Paralimibaculum aggregatum]|uniref:Uncharacterized protein n=1 Tax=Paralimibaculum aggregatum TaxID=3036245 RepID=A0ABQ6LHN3_9RHOB|nr:hypothetical protein [Limibaculum sp. NKW23]GMG81941.1 hypothetical protein LNKW23_11540 [Limibaculum sp. NKW23]